VKGLKFAALIMAVWVVSGLVYAQQAAPTTATATVAKTDAAPVAPVLAEIDALKIENAFLKIDAAQKNLDTLKASFQALLTSLQKPGYVIGQGADGKLTYQPEPKPEPKK
jgi:hypothetical protein